MSILPHFVEVAYCSPSKINWYLTRVVFGRQPNGKFYHLCFERFNSISGQYDNFVCTSKKIKNSFCVNPYFMWSRKPGKQYVVSLTFNYKNQDHIKLVTLWLVKSWFVFLCSLFLIALTNIYCELKLVFNGRSILKLTFNTWLAVSLFFSLYIVFKSTRSLNSSVIVMKGKHITFILDKFYTLKYRTIWCWFLEWPIKN